MGAMRLEDYARGEAVDVTGAALVLVVQVQPDGSLDAHAVTQLPEDEADRLSPGDLAEVLERTAWAVRAELAARS